MQDLYILHYNNYYNRIVKMESTLSDYLNSRYYDGKVIKNISFNPNDGVTTTQVAPFVMNGDYCVLADSDTSAIVSRWFIMEAQRTRTGQYILKLQRDLIADYYDEVVAVPMFIEKATVDIDDPAIFNKEDMTFNEIKTDEYLLKDETGCGWVVGYIPNDSFGEQTDITAPISATSSTYDLAYNTLGDFYNAFKNVYKYGSSVAQVNVDTYSNNKCVTLQKRGSSKYTSTNGTYRNKAYLYYSSGTSVTTRSEQVLFKYNMNTITNYVQTAIGLPFITSDDQIKELERQVGKIVRIGTSASNYKYYQVTLNSQLITQTFSVNSTDTSELFNYMDSNLTRTGSDSRGFAYSILGTAGAYTYSVEFSYTTYVIGLQQMFTNVKVTIPASNQRLHLEDSPYDMFAIPFSDSAVIFKNGDTYIQGTNKGVAISIAQAIASQSGDANIYDIQILPYCPAREVIKSIPGTYTRKTESQAYLLPGIKYTIETPSQPSGEGLGIISGGNLYLEKYQTNSSGQLEPFEGRYIVELRLDNDVGNIIITEKSGNQTTISFREYYESQETWTVELDVNSTYVPPASVLSDIGGYIITNKAHYRMDIVNSFTSDIKSGDSILNTLIWCSSSQFTFNIPTSGFSRLVSNNGVQVIESDNMGGEMASALQLGLSAEDVKTKNQCTLFRLCSPNYSTAFDVNAQMNRGISLFNVDCSYRPYSPYIHLNPDFNGLYGSDFDDARGLICGGDFSITQVTSAWANYQLNNKNYEKIFDRQIQNMESINRYQRIQAWGSAISGVAQGAAAGQLAFGGTGGMVAGSIMSAVGGAIDVATTYGMQREAINYAKDNFGYSLGNIQAIPQGLSRVTTINNNNKIFPVLEYYTCTGEEQIALQNKMMYNGMTVMRIDYMENFFKSNYTYIKGQVIRLELHNEDFHCVNAIAQELVKGVYIQ